MDNNVSGIRGEFRALTPGEIGDFVRATRDARRIKRISLAADAAVSEKTLERLEAGQAVNAATYRAVAKALGFPEEAFIGERYIPTPDEAEAAAARMVDDLRSKHVEVPVVRLTDPRQFVALLGTHGVIFDDSLAPPEVGVQCAELKTSICEWNDISEDLTPAQQFDAGQSLIKETRQLEARGFVVKLGMVRNWGRHRLTYTVVTIFPVRHPAADQPTVYLPKPGDAQIA